MVVALKPLSLGQGKGGKAERQDVKGAGEIRVLRHKTFHRYTSESRGVFEVKRGSMGQADDDSLLGST
jgi:hypothetical protein